ncbi:Hypothetical protein D9617_29g007150 [Elsinoe fawcettii]|nr:Hypothetical protein D9617_29g007150 [Elsinoe fawcettii]
MPSSRSSAANGDSGTKRREFSDLHPKDQQIKQTKKLCIEANWHTPIEHCLPARIVPRVEVKKGAKARVDDAEAEPEIWWNWSVELLKAIEELSIMTEGDVGYAKNLLTIEVEGRQQNPRSSQRKVLEVLLGDVQKVVDEQRKRLAAGYHQDVVSDAGHGAQLDRGQYYSTAPDRLVEGPSRKRVRQTIAEEGYDDPKYTTSDNNDSYPTDNQHVNRSIDPALVPRAGPANMLAEDNISSPAPFAHDSVGSTPGTPANASSHSPFDLSKVVKMKAEAAKLRMSAAKIEYDADKMEAAYLDNKLSYMHGALPDGTA